MRTHYLTRKVYKGIDSVVEVLSWVANAAIVVITLIFIVDVGGRALLNMPLYGSTELVEITMLILGFAFVYATKTRQHVKMEVLSPRLTKRSRTILMRFASLLEFGISAVITYEVFIKALHMLKNYEVSPFIEIPMGPPVLALSISLFLSCLISLLQAIDPQVSEEKSEGGLGI
jgi:TRAP-type C4-dicarboxylate transport system permease small subunit